MTSVFHAGSATGHSIVRRDATDRVEHSVTGVSCSPATAFANGILMIALALCLLTYSAGAQSIDFSSSNLPVVVIETDGTPIPEDEKIPARMGVIRYEGRRNHIDSAFTDFSGPIAIELRGRTSLMYDQKQFLLKTLDENGEDVNVSLMDFPAEHDWILYAPAVDKALMRNVLVYSMANAMGRYASRTRFCELVIDGDYRGIYVLMERIKRDKNRVAISKLTPDVLDGEKLTGGYILSIDHNGKPTNKGFPGAFDSLGYYVYWYVYPRSKNINIYQELYIIGYIDTFEKTMREWYFNDTRRGYPAFIDVDSFIDYILINEWANNVDGFIASLYMHKDRYSKGGKLTAGPVWDFNSAFGNCDYSDADRTDGWRIHYGRVPFWWRRLLQDPVFVAKLQSRWAELRSGVFHEQHLEHVIDSLVSQLDEAQERHFARWDLLGRKIWPNAFAGESFEEEIDYLKQWIWARLTWMDANIHSIGLPLETPGTTGIQTPIAASAPLLDVYPQPSTGVVTISYDLRAAGAARIVIRDALGREVRSSDIDATEAGVRQSNFTLYDLPNGLYHVSLMIGGRQSAAGTIILISP
jgi:hypothetical protein